MSASGGVEFNVEDLPIGPLEDGTSVLLTGDDREALESVFYRLVSAEKGEHSLILATDESGVGVQRSLGQAKRGSKDRSSVLACTGSSAGENVTTVDDTGDLTTLGMELSMLVSAPEIAGGHMRSGILLTSTLCAEADDTRSVYRFLNSNFLTELRRNEAIGVAAIDTSDDVGGDANSIVTGMQTSFTGRIHVETTRPGSATLEISGLGDDRTVDVSI
jgi:hypothetical protein